MADNNQNNTNVNFNGGDILGSLSGDVSGIKRDVSGIHQHTTQISSDIKLLEDIDSKLSQIISNSARWSQTSARSRTQDTFESTSSRRGEFGRSASREFREDSRRGGSRYSNRRVELDIDYRGYLDGLREALLDGLGASQFRQGISNVFDELARGLGVNVNEIERTLGSQFGRKLSKTVKQSQLFSNVRDILDNAAVNIADTFRNRNMRKVVSDPFLNEYQRASHMNSVNNIADAISNVFHPKKDSEPRNMSKLTSMRSDANPTDVAILAMASDLHFIYEKYKEKDKGPTPPGQPPEQFPNQSNLDSTDTLDISPSDIIDLSPSEDDVWRYDPDSSMSNIGEISTGAIEAASGEASSSLPAIAEGAVTDTELATVGTELATVSESTGLVASGMTELSLACPELLVALLAVEAASWLISKQIEKFKACFEPAIEGIQQFTETLHDTFERFYKSEEQKLKEEDKRLRDDVETLVRKPFEILNSAAEEWYSAWDNNLKVINATQGYTKEGLQSLMSSYAERLREEGLSSYVSAANISDNLAKVISSGLSGEVATEFAYLATILSEAIPTQDFFSYADTYSTIAANAMSLGKSQSEAIAEANKQLQEFANSILYASRQVSGGFSSGLSSASDILASSVKIANTARIGDSSQIASILTSITASVSSVAPDLASSLVDTVVSAATGGNASELVALRSLAGTGASNTAFLTALAKDPKKVISTMFSTLSTYQSMSDANFMEVAENLSSVFGMSMDTFTRINFSKLAEVVESASVGTDALDENLKLLKDGQTTTTEEQLRMQQVNKMILDEGLSYVLDNEAARTIQQHMWDQELAKELMDAEYGVELIGSTKEMFLGIAETIEKVLDFLNPLSYLNDIAELVGTAAEGVAMQSDIMQVLKLGQVGEGNYNQLRNYTTYDVDSLTKPIDNLVSLMGGNSLYEGAKGLNSIRRSIVHGNFTRNDMTAQGLGLLANGVDNLFTSLIGGFNSSSSIQSQYKWASGSKTMASLVGVPLSSGFQESQLDVGQHKLESRSSTRFDSFLKSMEQAATGRNEKGEQTGKQMSYDEWVSTAKKFGISDISSAAEGAGLTEDQLKSQFLSYQAKEASQEEKERNERQDEFWSQSIEFIQYFKETYQPLVDTDLQNVKTSIDDFNKYFKETWVETKWDTDWISEQWKTGWIHDRWDKEFYDGFYTKMIKEQLVVYTSSIKKLLNDRYNTYKTYSEETKNAASNLKKSKDNDKNSTSNAILELAGKLTNIDELKDPQVQTNALLSQILIVVQAIMQAENQSGSSALATTLSGLALGFSGGTSKTS